MFIQQNVDINVMFAKEKFYPNNLVQYNFNPKQYMSKKCWSSFVNVVIVVIVVIVVVVVIVVIVVVVTTPTQLQFNSRWV